MPYKLIVLHTSGTPPRTALQIIKSAKELGLRGKYVRLQELNIAVEGDGSKVLLRGQPLDVDIAIVRGLGGPQSVEEYALRFDIIKALEDYGATVINTYESLTIARDKLRTLTALKRAGISVPESIVTLSIDAALHYTQKWGKVVVKPIIGSLGRGIMLIDDVDIAYNIYRRLLSWYQPLLIQRYYEKEGNRDLRVLVINGEPVANYYRVAREGFFKTNVAQGGKVEKAEPREDVTDMAIKAVEALGLFYAGVDIMETKDGPFVIEVNASPNWKGALQLGIDPSKVLVREVLELMKR